MNLVEEITNNFKEQEREDREARAKKKQDATKQAAQQAEQAAQQAEQAAQEAQAAKTAQQLEAERELDDRARHFSRLQLARLHSTPHDQRNALIEEMAAENKRRLIRPCENTC